MIATPDDALTASVPAAGPLDPFTRARLRSILATYFGEFPAIDLHLDLLDTRGAWYAERALGAWSPAQPDAFFGVVTHVVRTQLGGSTPQPDVEGWVAAGRPIHDRRLAVLWDEVHALWSLTGSRIPVHDREPDASAAACTLDSVLTRWPDQLIDSFLLAYIKLEITLRRRHVVLPPIGT
jgi:hypothetical protein